jgi:hypothetical protein
MKTLLMKLALIAASTLALAACNTAPRQPDPAPAQPPAAKKTVVEMEYEIRMKEIEARSKLDERSQLTLIKFAAESNNDFAKGMVAGMLGSGGPKQAATPEPSRRGLLDSVAQADAIELRKMELEERNSWWNRGLQVFDRALGYRQFSKGLGFRRFEIEQSNGMERYRFDTIRGTQRDAYDFSESVLEHGPYVLPAGAAPVGE